MIDHDHGQALERIIRANQQLWSILEAARDCDLPDWFVGAGIIRNAVWDHLHGYREPTPCTDVDVAFFDPHDLTPARDQAAQAHLHARWPDVPWEATNQAAVHCWYEQVFGYPVAPLRSSQDGIGTWPETATCVGVQLLPDDTLLVAAPCGLADLLGMVLRRNPRRVSLEEFRRRLAQKRLQEKWPRVQVVDG
jgi:uncharacterized protein